MKTVDEMMAEVKELEREIMTIEAEMSSTQRDMDVLSVKINENQRYVTAASSNIKKASEAIEKARLEISNNERALASLNTEAHPWKEERAELNRIYDEMETSKNLRKRTAEKLAQRIAEEQAAPSLPMVIDDAA